MGRHLLQWLLAKVDIRNRTNIKKITPEIILYFLNDKHQPMHFTFNSILV